MTTPHIGRIEGYAIISEDGMLATADRVMPDSLVFEADQRFYENGLDGVDVVVHGRHSQERQTRSPLRYRLMLSRRVAGIAPHPSNPRARLWNPAGADLYEALAALAPPGPNIGVIGGGDVFELFLDRYDAFYLTRAPGVTLSGGRPVFPAVPGRTPEDVLAGHGLAPGPSVVLDPLQGLTMVGWLRDHSSRFE
jgi:dihydrofolate reductase